MKRNQKLGLGALRLLSAIGYLVYAGVKQSSVYYMTIGEFLNHKAEFVNQGVRVAGRVAPDSVVKRATSKGTELRFAMYDFKGEGKSVTETLPVNYTGILPDMFAAGRDVIVEGKYVGGTFQARNLITSCPSKYEAAPGSAQGSGEAYAEHPSS